MDLKAAIEAIRKAKHISKADMAKMLDMDPSNYGRLESRGDKLTIEQLRQIAKALGVTVTDILSWGENSNQNTDIDNDSRERIEELEASVKDKSFIIKTLRKDIDNIAIMFSVVFEHFAKKINVGELQMDNVSENQKLEDKKNSNKGIEIVYPRVYTDNDLYEIVAYIHSNFSIFYFLLKSLAESQTIIEDNVFAIALISYERNRMKRLTL